MPQATAIDPGVLAIRRSMGAHYGFNSDFWPVDATGRLHFLGDGAPGDDNGWHMLRLLRDQTESLVIAPTGVEQELYWTETWSGFGAFDYYREISEGDALAFDPTANDLAEKNVDETALRDWIRAFPDGTWHRHSTDEPVLSEEAASNIDGFRGDNSLIYNSFSRTLGVGHEYWNPYQGSVFFLSFGGGDWLVTRPFKLYTRRTSLGGEWERDTTAGTIVMGRKTTGVPNAATTPPWSVSELIDSFNDLTSTGWSFDHETWWGDPDIIEWEAEAINTWAGARMASLRVRVANTLSPTLFSGTIGGFFGFNESVGAATVEKVHEDGSRATEGTIPARVVDMQSPTGSALVNSIYDNISKSQAIAITDGWSGGMPSNALFYGEIHEVDYSYFTYLCSSQVLPLETTMALGVYVVAEDGGVRAGVGTLVRSTREGDAPGDWGVGGTVFDDLVPWRARSDYDSFLNFRWRTLRDVPDAPAAGWVQLATTEALGWCKLTATEMRFTALLSDDGDCHDPRANTATETIEAFLALGDGLCYEGVLGSIPRPRGGATGTLLGRAIVGDVDFAIDVLPLPDESGHLAVMVKGGTVEAWRSATDVWTGSLDQAFPPSVVAALGEAPAPALDLRFLLRDWPTPTGILTLGEHVVIIDPRRRWRDWRWQDAGGESTSPPFTSRLATFDRFPDHDPRSPVVVQDEGGGGGEAG